MNPGSRRSARSTGVPDPMESYGRTGKGYVAARRTARRRADRPDPGRCAVQPVAGLRTSREHPRRPGHRLRQAVDDGRDQRHVRRTTPWRSPPASCRTSSSSSSTSKSRREVRKEDGRTTCRSTATCCEGRRARTVGPFGELPEERQHHLHRRPGAEDGGGDAPHAELRAASR